MEHTKENIIKLLCAMGDNTLKVAMMQDEGTELKTTFKKKASVLYDVVLIMKNAEYFNDLVKIFQIEQ